MVAPNRNYELKKSRLFIEFHVIFFHTLKILNSENEIFKIYSINFAVHFAAWCSRITSPLPPTNTPGLHNSE
jgi:hypothetical protein